MDKIINKISAQEMNQITQLWASEDHKVSEAVDYILNVILETARTGRYRADIFEQKHSCAFSFYWQLEPDYWRNRIKEELEKLGYFVLLKKDYSKGFYYRIDWDTKALFKKKV